MKGNRRALVRAVLGALALLSPAVPSAADDLVELSKLDVLREHFNRDQDEARIVLLLSPT